MSIRRIQYQVDYLHIITFQEEYKKAIAPYFGFEGLEYGIDNENTINEGVRLIFKQENLALFFRKEAIVIIYEGNGDDLKNQNSIFKIFWELYEKVKGFYGYTKTIQHTLIVHAVDIRDSKEVVELLRGNKFLSQNPFGNLDEFMCVYHFTKDEILYKFNFGNYSERDIKIHDLSPFKAKFNEDLVNNVGIMGRLEITEPDRSPTFTKFKSLLSKAKINLTLFNLISDEK